jgi:hypothetical protein
MYTDATVVSLSALGSHPQGVSHNYAGALQISEKLLRQIEERAHGAGEQCVMGPQVGGLLIDC